MRTGPGSFAGAPVSQALVGVTAGSSLALQLARNWHKQVPHALEAVLQLFAYRNLGHAFFGVSLMYYWRLLERQWGSSKYGSAALLVIVSTTGAQHVVAHSLSWPLGHGHGPTALAFANLVTFAADVPATWQGSVLGLPVSDKVGYRTSSC